MQTRVIEPPAAEPVTVDEAKAYARAFGDLDDEDALWASFVRAAREKLELFTPGRVYVTQTLRTSWLGWPCRRGPIRLPRAPVQSLVSVEYRNAEGDYESLAVDGESPAVALDDDGDPSGFGVVRMLDGSGWPETDLARITYVAGYGDAESVPESAKIAIEAIAARLYETRFSDEEDDPGKLPKVARSFAAGLMLGAYPYE